MKQRVGGVWVGPATAPWAPLATLEADYATEVEADAAYAPLAYGTFVRKVQQTLTDKTSWAGTSDEQWGTEEAVFDDALLPKLTNVTVDARVEGVGVDWSNTNTLSYRVEISFDGGSTWDAAASYAGTRISSGGTSTTRHLLRASHLATGTVTGDIQARCMALNGVGAAYPTDLVGGKIIMTVEVHQ